MRFLMHQQLFCSSSMQEIRIHISKVLRQRFRFFAAHARGLVTCWLGIATIRQEDIKALLGIPDNKALLGRVAVGVPVKDSMLNTFERPRVPVDDLTTWYGLRI